MRYFNLESLRDQRFGLAKEAMAGRIAVVMNEEGPLFLAVPLDAVPLKPGINVDLATKLFDDELISLVQASKLAGMSLQVFMEHLRTVGVPIARPRPGELEKELADFGQSD